MKIKLLLAFFILSFSLGAQEINWVTLEEAVEMQKKEPRKIMMDAYTVWCGPCKLLDKNTFQNADVANYVNANYYAVKFNAEGNEEIRFKGKIFKNPDFDPNKKGRNGIHELTRYFQVSAYPTILFLDENSDLIGPIPGYKTPRQLELFLNLFKEDTYKSITSKELWEEYVANFNYSFSE
jgi:thioredoxin-related protein